MKLISLYTESHRIFKDKWFLPTLQDDYDIEMYYSDVSGSGRYMEKDWSTAIVFKTEMIISFIKENWGEVFVYSDVDIQFFKPTKQILLKIIGKNDILFQKDDPSGNLCAGFWVARANRKVLKLWQITNKFSKKEGREQPALNKILRWGTKNPIAYLIKNLILAGDCKYACLPISFFGGGTLTGKPWEPGMELPVPEGIVLHHANFTGGVENKIAQLEYVKNVVDSGRK